MDGIDHRRGTVSAYLVETFLLRFRCRLKLDRVKLLSLDIVVLFLVMGSFLIETNAGEVACRT